MKNGEGRSQLQGHNKPPGEARWDSVAEAVFSGLEGHVNDQGARDHGAGSPDQELYWTDSIRMIETNGKTSGEGNNLVQLDPVKEDSEHNLDVDGVTVRTPGPPSLTNIHSRQP